MPVNTQALTDAEITQLFDSPGEVPPDTFEIALVLGGTVSSGAYTAGALDFLFEALNEWTARRDHGDAGIPRHKSVIRVISGTSGGGVNAAIAARALAYGYPPVSRGTPPDIAVQNPFYDTWVNRLTLDAMLKTSDISANASPVSVLNGQVIDSAAAYLVSTAFGPYTPRSYLAQPLRLILTVTNLNGIPYRIDFGSHPGPAGEIDLSESFVSHADYVRVAVVYPGSTPDALRPDEFSLGFENARLPNALDWMSFGQFACATSAFPIGFPPRRLNRPLEDYRYRVLAVPSATENGASVILPLVPDWAVLQGDSGLQDSYAFLAVDGGVTDNEPIELARTALAGISGRNPRDGMKANRAVLLIDPFAGKADPTGTIALNLLSLAESFLGAVLQQTRYDTRDLLLAADPGVFSRFMITATRGDKLGDDALATAGLSAFIGFASAAFRRHDYLLGRQNCQDFLRNVFVLPAGNPLFKDTWDGVSLADYEVQYPDGMYRPIIPLCGDARVPEALDPWPVHALDPAIYKSAVEQRFAAVVQHEGGSGLAGFVAWLVAQAGEGAAADKIIGMMNDALKTWGLA